MICLASTLMVLDHSVGSSRRPRVGGTDHDRPVGHSLQILRSRSHIYFAIKILPYILYYIVLLLSRNQLGILQCIVKL